MRRQARQEGVASSFIGENERTAHGGLVNGKITITKRFEETVALRDNLHKVGERETMLRVAQRFRRG